MESSWSGVVEDAFFNGEHFNRCRKILQPEYEYSGRSSSQSYYVIGADVGRRGCDSVACVFKVTPQDLSPAIKSLVNICIIPADTHFEEQAIYFKKLFYKYKARRIAIDANGMGIGLIDYMVKPQVDPETGENLPDFGVYGGTQENAVDEYKKYRTANTEEDAMYLIKANAPVNTECYSNAQVQMSTGKLRFLIDKQLAKEKLLNTVKGAKMSPEDREKYLLPFTFTDILKDEMLNLREENEGINIILRQANKNMKKDKFSAFIYGLYYIKIEEEKRKKRKKFNASEWRFFN